MTPSFTRRSVLAALGLALAATSAQSQDFPNRPITLMVGSRRAASPTSPRGSMLMPCRRLTGQRVIVENKTGAGGGVAAAAVQNAAPDGYMLLVFSGSQHATVPAAGNATYEPVKGFAPVTFLFNSVVVLTVPADSPAQVP